MRVKTRTAGNAHFRAKAPKVSLSQLLTEIGRDEAQVTFGIENGKLSYLPKQTIKIPLGIGIRVVTVEKTLRITGV
jgi:hypothetical protein